MWFLGVPGLALPTEVGGITVGGVERHCCLDQRYHRRAFQRRLLHKLECCHLVLAARLQARLDVTQALTSPKPKEHAHFFCTDKENWTFREVHQVAPLDGFPQRRGAEDG